MTIVNSACAVAAPEGVLSPSRYALFTTSSFSQREVADRCGDEGYSYCFVERAFLRLLRGWAPVNETSNLPGGLLPYLEQSRREGKTPVRLSFLPLHHVTVVPGARNVAFPFWEYPDIPNQDIGGDPRQNWCRAAARLDLILTACEFTRQAFRRAGVNTPIEVVPVPIAGGQFSIENWDPGQRVSLECPCYVLPQRPTTPRVNELVRRLAARTVWAKAERLTVPFVASDRLELSGVVYSTVLNPFDERKNWRGIIDAFVHALGDKRDAQLVIKLAASRSMAREALHNVLHYYRHLRTRHQCRLAVVAAWLTDGQMRDLVRGSTFYLNASRAEGACLPLADALAAGRPAIAPAHTAMAEYLDDRVAFVIPSHPQPAHWPTDPQRRLTTIWHETSRDDLAKQLRISYEVALHDLPRYRSLATQGRQRMHLLASEESVRQQLSEALSRVQGSGFRHPEDSR